MNDLCSSLRRINNVNVSKILFQKDNILKVIGKNYQQTDFNQLKKITNK